MKKNNNDVRRRLIDAIWCLLSLYRAKLDLTEVAKDGSSPSVSCLNFEPRVSKFPVLEASVASSTNATASSPFRWTCVYEGAFERWTCFE